MIQPINFHHSDKLNRPHVDGAQDTTPSSGDSFASPSSTGSPRLFSLQNLPGSTTAPSGTSTPSPDLKAIGDMVLSGDSSSFKIWGFPTGGPITSTPAVSADGTVIFGSADGTVYGVKHGAEEWQFPTGGEAFTSESLANDGTLYALSRNPVKERIEELKESSETQKPSVDKVEEWIIIDGTKIPVKVNEKEA